MLADLGSVHCRTEASASRQIACFKYPVLAELSQKWTLWAALPILEWVHLRWRLTDKAVQDSPVTGSALPRVWHVTLNEVERGSDISYTETTGLSARAGRPLRCVLSCLHMALRV